jgi:hypothetical protein
MLVVFSSSNAAFIRGFVCGCSHRLPRAAHVEERGPVHASVKEKRVCDRTIGA